MKKNKWTVMVLLVMLCALISGFAGKRANPEKIPGQDNPEEEFVSGDYLEETESGVIEDNIIWKNESKQVLLDCYMGYLSFIRRNKAISSKNLPQEFGEEGVIAFCDVYGDELPELIYKEFVNTSGFRSVDLCIATFDGAKVRDIYRWESINSIAAGNVSYYLFQREAEKKVYLMFFWASETSTTQFDCLTETGNGLDRSIIVDAMVYPDYYGESNKYRIKGKETSEEAARAEVNRLKANATRIITHNMTDNGEEYYNREPYFYDNESAFVHSKPCNHMSYDDGIRYLREQIVGLGGDPDSLGYIEGDIIKFGHYEQDGNNANGKEEIEWEVLKVESDRLLVASKYALDCKKYNETYTDVTWETSTLREWMNNDFKNEAFTPEEQTKIPTVTVVNDNDPYYGMAGGNNTQDQVFCLSVNEIKNLIDYNWYYDDEMYGFSQKMIVEPTQYAINNGANVITITSDYYYKNLIIYDYTSDVIGCRGASWWLRSPGYYRGYANCVDFCGYAGKNNGCAADFGGLAVRPALYILNPKKIDPESIKLNESSATIYFGMSTALTATVLPEDATNKSVTWSSSNPAVATVSNGTVKANNTAGKTTITAQTVNGLTATCEVTVFADNNPSNIFADIKYGSWQYNAAKSVYEKGYMTGKGDLSGRVLFSPDTNINRSQFVVALYSMDGSPAVTYKQKFSDVKSSAWYANQVTWASDNGIVAGNADGTFGVNGKATREQLALMFYKYAVYKNYNVSVSASTSLDGFTDAGKVDSWALTAMKWAVERGIISGKGNASAGYRLDPTKGATRAECAAMMNKFDEIYSKSLKTEDEDLEEPLALPLEEAEDIAVPEEEAEDIIEDEDVVPEDKEEEDTVDDEDVAPETEIEEVTETEDTDS